MVLPGPELSIIVPTYNEVENIETLIGSLNQALVGILWEVIFVDDDSPDGTSALVKEIGFRDHRIRCIQRIYRRGLSSACIEGMLSSSAPYLAVMDADMQHDEKLLPSMLATLKNEKIDVVIGSRYVEGGRIERWEKRRSQISQFGTRLSRLILKVQIQDPMSGFFMIRRSVFIECVRDVSGLGYKILVDLFASAKRPLSFKELPYQFRKRIAGDSKLDSLVAWDFGMLLFDKLMGKIVPVRFIAFGLIGGLGIVVHFSCFLIVFKLLKNGFATSQIIATVIAMTFNFSLNNILTYRDVRLRGWQWLRGWFSFTLACSIGAVANVGIASYLYQTDSKWVLAALAGVIVGAVWNYAVTATYTWERSSVK